MKETEKTIFLDPCIEDRNLDSFKAFSQREKKFDTLYGCTKKEVTDHLGLVYNDIHSDLWMYRINHKTNVFKKNYLYLYFDKNKVNLIKLRRFKFS